MTLWTVLQCLAYVALTPLVLFGALAIFLRVLGGRGATRGVCRFCGCTENDCRACIRATGYPCSWIDERHTICSRCVDHMAEADLDDLSPHCSPLNSEPERRKRGKAREFVIDPHTMTAYEISGTGYTDGVFIRAREVLS
jgi:hypothetical protein